jgi:hypothetical protein
MQGLSGDTKFHGKGLENNETFLTRRYFRGNSLLFRGNSRKRTKFSEKVKKRLSRGCAAGFSTKKPPNSGEKSCSAQKSADGPVAEAGRRLPRISEYDGLGLNETSRR